MVHKAVINSLQDFINRYKNILQNHVIDTTLASGNPLHYRRNFWERILKLVMTIDDNIKHEKLQYDIDCKASKISALLAR